MAGMLQVITYLLAVYLVVKGLEVLQIGLASSREDRSGLITFGAIVLVFCIVAAIAAVVLQDTQATSMSKAFNR